MLHCNFFNFLSLFYPFLPSVAFFFFCFIYVFKHDLVASRSHNVVQSLVIYDILPKATALQVCQALLSELEWEGMLPGLNAWKENLNIEKIAKKVLFSNSLLALELDKELALASKYLRLAHGPVFWSLFFWCCLKTLTLKWRGWGVIKLLRDKEKLAWNISRDSQASNYRVWISLCFLSLPPLTHV